MSLPGSPGALVGQALTKQKADVFIPELWSGEVKRERDRKLTASLYTKRIPTLGRKGDRIHIPNISRAAVHDKLPERPVTLQARQETEWVMDITDYKEVSHMIEDVVGLQTAAAYNLRGEITRESGYALARDLDNAVLGHRAALNAIPAQVIYASSNGLVTGNGLPLSYATILAANLMLDDAEVPEEDRVWLVSAGQYLQLLNINQFISFDFNNTKPIATGVVGSILGTPVVKTGQIRANSLTGFTNGAQGVPEPTPGVAGSRYLPKQDAYTALPTTFTGDGRPVHSAILCHKDWLALAMPLMPTSEWSRENLYQADALVMTQQYGAKLFRPDHAVLIHTVGTLT